MTSGLLRSDQKPDTHRHREKTAIHKPRLGTDALSPQKELTHNAFISDFQAPGL